MLPAPRVNPAEDSGTLRFAEFVAALRPGGLTPSEAAAAAGLVIDGIAVAALGASEEGPRILATLAAETGARPVSPLIAGGRRVAAVDAARANGAAMHVLDFEPMWNPANHALSTTLPAVMAAADLVAEGTVRAEPVTGSRFLTALALGIEVQARLRLASRQFEPTELLFHPPGAVGPVGSAAAAACLFGFDAGAMRHAMGIAASRTGGILANVGSMTKALHCGGAAAAGLESAVLAPCGFTADADALFGPRGYGRAIAGRDFDIEELTAPAKALHIVEPGPAYKFYPSQYGTHFVITAALEARANARPGATPEWARIVTPRMAYVDRPLPATGLAGKFSFQYTAAVALIDGRVDIESFTDSRRFSDDVSRLMPKIEIEVDPERQGRFDRMAVGIEVGYSDGSRTSGRCDGPPGIWAKPAEPERVRRKARTLMERVYGKEHAARLIDGLEGVNGLSDGGLRAVLAMTAGERASLE